MNTDVDVVTAAMYNIHYWRGISHTINPPSNILEANMTIVESLESNYYHGKLLADSIPNYDAYSTVTPLSDIPRVYPDALYNPVKISPIPFKRAIKGAVFVATNCDPNVFRTQFTRDLMLNTELRVDSPGTFFNLYKM